MRKVHPTFLICALAVIGIAFGSQAVGGPLKGQEVWLVTPEEAAMPPAPAASGPRSRGLRPPDTGPIIELLHPVIDKPIPVPTEIDVQFTPRRAPVDVDSLKVTLLKLINLDITNRVKPYTSSSGIHIPNANLPSGQHDLRITLADAEGNISNKQVSLTIP